MLHDVNHFTTQNQINLKYKHNRSEFQFTHNNHNLIKTKWIPDVRQSL